MTNDYWRINELLLLFEMTYYYIYSGPMILNDLGNLVVTSEMTVLLILMSYDSSAGIF